MPAPLTTEKPSTSETPAPAVDNSANLAARQAEDFTKNEGIDSTNAGTQQQQPAHGQSQAKEKSEVEKLAEQEYEERMEDEYAKREGGA